MPGSPRTRPAKPALSRESIVAAALALVDELGVDAVTMRRVAAAVDTAPASLYVYVTDRDELMALVHDLAIEGVELPANADGDWRARLELLVSRVVTALSAHADIATVGRTNRATGPNSLRIVEELLRLLRTGGIPDSACAWAVDLFGQHIAASALENAPPPPVLSTEDYPAIRALAPLLASGDSATRAAWKLRVIIDGILPQHH